MKNKTVLLLGAGQEIYQKFQSNLVRSSYKVAPNGINHQVSNSMAELENYSAIVIVLKTNERYNMIQLAKHIINLHQKPVLFYFQTTDAVIINEAKNCRPQGLIFGLTPGYQIHHYLDMAILHFNQQSVFVKSRFQGLNKQLIKPLTKSELKIMNGLSEGKSNRQLAEEYYISLNTIKTHIRHIYEKLNISSRWELIAFIQEQAPSANNYLRLKAS